jgi:quercetin dioxygenase-like cupin family protein
VFVNHIDERTAMAVIDAPSAPTHELDGTRFTSLATPRRGSRETAVWQVEIEPGTDAVPHQMSREEVFIVLAGRAGVVIGSDRSAASAGDAIVVPPLTDFALTNAGDSVLRLLCCLPVGGEAIAGGARFVPPWAE